ncbi:hypothetical protein SAMN04487898_11846 [Pedobacter sp. ok626]|uniref:hypothetical protein n=1 Tax=Pedobacter sp. ok626 TaxID=1761882 RepID=UPI00088F07B0|nr:hypothetical protein [Pedobacter sp. ok626]SDL39735.1 hypothetical protein SAMN04487898_11846 [Pedobacter sp. ok626]
MGEFLQTRLITTLSVSKDHLDEMETKDKIVCLNRLLKVIVANPQSFVLEEGEDSYSWKLKPDILEGQLVPFLEEYYKDFYGEDSNWYARECKPTLDFLSVRPKDAPVLEYLENEKNDIIFFDKSDYNLSTKDRRLIVLTSELRLSFEGKIIYESIFGHVSFFTKCIRKVYAHSPLGGALSIDIY